MYLLITEISWSLITLDAQRFWHRWVYRVFQSMGTLCLRARNR